MDYIALATTLGAPVSYIGVGFALYKVYNRVVSAEVYAKRANHNTTALLKALLKRSLIDTDDLKELELNGE